MQKETELRKTFRHKKIVPVRESGFNNRKEKVVAQVRLAKTVLSNAARQRKSANFRLNCDLLILRNTLDIHKDRLS